LVNQEFVAVYLDFENLVASRYDFVHGKGSWRDDNVGTPKYLSAQAKDDLRAAWFQVRTTLDYAATLGVRSIVRAYANWALPAFAEYGRELTDNAVDLVQLFPVASSKNGADIRLATDVIEDLDSFRHITHVMIGAGDSDYIPVAQKVRRRGKRVIGLSITGSNNHTWPAACDEFRLYESLLGTEAITESASSGAEESSVELLRRAVGLELARSGEDWTHPGSLKQLMTRLRPSYDQADDGFKSFGDFLRSVPEVEWGGKDGNKIRLVTERDRALSRKTATVAKTELAQAPETESDLSPTAQECRAAVPEFAKWLPLTDELVALAVLAAEKYGEIARLKAPENSSGLGSEVDRVLVEAGHAPEAAKRARALVMALVPVVVRDDAGRYGPNDELTPLADTVPTRLRLKLAERMRDKVPSATAVDLIQAILGQDVDPLQADSIASAMTYAVTQDIREALTQWFVTPPVLDDVLSVLDLVPHDAVITSSGDLRRLVGAELERVGRPPDTVPWEPLWNLLLDSTSLTAQGAGWTIGAADKPSRLTQILTFHLGRLVAAQLLPPSFDQACSLVLRDRTATWGRHLVQATLGYGLDLA
jgi:hypothetical protein